MRHEEDFVARSVNFTESIINRLISNDLENVKYYHKRFWEILKWLK